MSQTLFVGRFQYSRPQMSLNLDGAPDHTVGEIIEFHLRALRVLRGCNLASRRLEARHGKRVTKRVTGTQHLPLPRPGRNERPSQAKTVSRVAPRQSVGGSFGMKRTAVLAQRGYRQRPRPRSPRREPGQPTLISETARLRLDRLFATITCAAYRRANSRVFANHEGHEEHEGIRGQNA